MIEIDQLKFDEKGLIPAVVTDYYTKKVLTLAYMNRQSLEISIKEGKTCFWSRSRNKLWRKGETSGNYQHIVCIKADCDRDALTVEVVKDGPACHLGTDSCFNDYVYKSDNLGEFSLNGLYDLFEQGIDKILKKVGEECTEVVIAGKGGDKAETIFEIADLTYHLMVLMVEMCIRPKDVADELCKRHIIDHKVKQQKMK